MIGMRRIILSLMVLLLVFGCVQEKSKDYFPLKVGNYWIQTINVSIGGETISKTIRLEIKKTEEIEGKTNYIVDYYMDGEKIQQEYYYMDGTKMVTSKRVLSGVAVEFEPDQVWYDFGSDNWKWEGKVGSLDCTSNGELLGTEKVSVPAGEFDSLKTKLTITCSDGSSATAYRWFADGVGLVKEESSTSGLQVVSKMKEYKVG